MLVMKYYRNMKNILQEELSIKLAKVGKLQSCDTVVINMNVAKCSSCNHMAKSDGCKHEYRL